MLLVLATVLGCGHSPNESIAFTDEWATEVSRSKAQDKENSEIVLIGKKQGVHAGIRVDEEGKPQVSIGKNAGLRTDLNVKHGAPSIKVKYELKW